MIAKHKIVSTIATVLLALGMTLLSGGAANASVSDTGPCNGPKRPITDNFGHPGVKLCGSVPKVVNFGGGNIINVVIGVVGDTRPIYADGGSGWHRVGNGAAYHENTCHSAFVIGMYLADNDPHVVGVIGTDNYKYVARANPDGSFSAWSKLPGGTVPCNG